MSVGMKAAMYKRIGLTHSNRTISPVEISAAAALTR